MTAFALLFTLSAIGISEVTYLIRKRIAEEKPVCIIGASCSIVLKSKYHKFFIIPNDILGLLLYITVSCIAAFLVIGVEPMDLWNISLKVLVALGSLFSLILTYLQWRVIKAWCFWCIMSACTIWLMGIIILTSKII